MEEAYTALYQEFLRLQLLCLKQAEMLQHLTEALRRQQGSAPVFNRNFEDLFSEPVQFRRDGLEMFSHTDHRAEASHFNKHVAHTHTSPAHTHTSAAHTHTSAAHTHTSAAHTHTSAAHTYTSPAHTHTSPAHTHTSAAHTHTSAAHTYTSPAHTHPSPAHTHTSAAHTYTSPAHTHTSPAHTHTSAAHTYTSPAHTHTSAAHTHTSDLHPAGFTDDPLVPPFAGALSRLHLEPVQEKKEVDGAASASGRGEMEQNSILDELRQVEQRWHSSQRPNQQQQQRRLWASSFLTSEMLSEAGGMLMSRVTLHSRVCEFCHAVFPGHTTTRGEFLRHLTTHIS